jgi:hypothetical protein
MADVVYVAHKVASVSAKIAGSTGFTTCSWKPASITTGQWVAICIDTESGRR